MQRSDLPQVRRCIVKVGSALITADGAGLDLKAIDSWVEQLAQLHARGIELVLVSSGSIAEGISRLGWTARPREVDKLQAAAAVGQMGLVQAYESAFKKRGI
ncbi:MAG: glutamate 5-kinase, partial [Granulosicoccaceae bacterium]